MPDFDERGELAPRDIVARAIDHEMKRPGVDCMFLDISHKPEAFVRQHFPMIYEKLLGTGIDLTKEPVPVVPAAHYTCGGVMVDDNGRTDVDGLYAIGEVSYTGLHGANRMASNSLLECTVYGWSAAEDIARRLPLAQKVATLPAWDESQVEIPDELVVIQHNWHELRLLMWDYVGIVRTTRRLERALRRITMLQQELDEYYARFRVSNNLLELRNLVQVAELIVRCAMLRKESRGLHYTLDYPQPLPDSGPSILSPRSHKEIKVLGQSGKAFRILLLWPADRQPVAETLPCRRGESQQHPMRRSQLGLRHVSTQSQMPAHRPCPFDERITNIHWQHHAKKLLR